MYNIYKHIIHNLICSDALCMRNNVQCTFYIMFCKFMHFNKIFKTTFEYIRKKFRFVHTNTFCEYRKKYAHRLACILLLYNMIPSVWFTQEINNFDADVHKHFDIVLNNFEYISFYRNCKLKNFFNLLLIILITSNIIVKS